MKNGMGRSVAAMVAVAAVLLSAGVASAKGVSRTSSSESKVATFRGDGRSHTPGLMAQRGVQTFRSDKVSMRPRVSTVWGERKVKFVKAKNKLAVRAE